MTSLDDLAGTAARREPWVRRAAWTVLLLGLLAFLVRGADRPADPHVGATAGAATSGERRPLEGFEEIVLRVTTGNGTSADWCALLAATAEARRQGLQGQTSLRGYDAMVFRFPEPTLTRFWMHRTPLPLSIAWFAPDGSFVSATKMDPCPADDPGDCPTYGPKPASAYLHAVEAAQGHLGRLGIGPGARISFPGGSCG